MARRGRRVFGRARSGSRGLSAARDGLSELLRRVAGNFQAPWGDAALWRRCLLPGAAGGLGRPLPALPGYRAAGSGRTAELR